MYLLSKQMINSLGSLPMENGGGVGDRCVSHFPSTPPSPPPYPPYDNVLQFFKLGRRPSPDGFRSLLFLFCAPAVVNPSSCCADLPYNPRYKNAISPPALINRTTCCRAFFCKRGLRQGHCIPWAISVGIFDAARGGCCTVGLLWGGGCQTSFL